ncbi:hypothetical protein KPH14_005463 [Odynerus spinipes]|uniref:Ribosomal protein n=1 Tax=Odynerus spinipes TaxID=1348599 RepID=A0AAD9VJF1_9HYME|nr:hypothetical protein KPH14_005463 [Odynerus spinipes]
MKTQCYGNMSSFSILRFGAMCQTIQSIVPRLLNATLGKNTGTILRNVHHMCERQRLNLIPNTLARNDNSLLAPSSLPTINLVCGIKVKGQLRLRCQHCYYVARHERLYVMCKKHPRHKQTQLKKKEYKTWILTHATQSRIRPW